MYFQHLARRIRPRTHLGRALLGRFARPVPAVVDASGAIPPGSVVGVHGPNGAGKTTLLALLAGVCAPDGGRLERAPLPVAFLAPGRLGLVERLTVAQHLRLHRAPTVPEADVAAVAHDLGLEGLADRRADELSTGQATRLALACAWAAGCRTWLLDEVTSHLDDAGLDAFFALVRRRGDTLVAVAHDERTLARCDRVLALEAGRTGEEPAARSAQVAGSPGPLPTSAQIARLVTAADRRAGGLGQRLVGVAVAVLVPWQLAAQGQRPAEAAAALWCGLLALALQVAVATRPVQRFFRVVHVGLDDVLRARGAGLGALLAACALPPLLLGLAGVTVAPVAIAAWRDVAPRFDGAAVLALVAAAVAMTGLAGLSWGSAVLVRNARPLPWLLHAATLVLAPIAVVRPVWPDVLRQVGEWTPAGALAPALRHVAGVAGPPPQAAWLAAGLWLLAGGAVTAWGVSHLRHQGSLGIRSQQG